MARARSWPNPRFTHQLLLNAAWLVFIYMLLLTMFEMIELVRPKPCVLRPQPPPTPRCPIATETNICPECGKQSKRKC